jgi:hypothetical protein
MTDHPPIPAPSVWHDLPPLSRHRLGVSFWVATLTGAVTILTTITALALEMNR